VTAAGCQHDIGDTDGAFYDWSGRAMHCAVDIDSSTLNNAHSSIDSGLDRARDRGEVVELYAHHPGVTVAIDDIDYVLAGARDRGLDFVTYKDFADPNQNPRGALALSFDDTTIAAWHDQLPLFAKYDARITFFLSRYEYITDDERQLLHEIAEAGHDVEAHTVNHLRAPDYVEANGMAAYVGDEVMPSIQLLEADGYSVTAFAYPFGSRTDQTDHAILEHVQTLRSVVFTWSEVASPCPL
jgi:peptidoglycan/xylan/chitin deacetylase (PgdA/CDA1 family)